MPAASAIVAVRQALAALLAADATVGPSWSWAWPGQDAASQRVVCFAPGATASHEVAAFRTGRVPRDEDVEVRVVCWAQRPELRASGVDAVELDAVALANAVENVVVGDPTLGGAVAWATVDGVELTVERAERGWAATAVVTVRARVRLT